MREGYLLRWSILFAVLMLFSGCGENAGEVDSVYYGEVTRATSAKVVDDGDGTVIGSILGGVVGDAISGGDIWYTLGGALLGGIIGYEYDETYGQRVDVALDGGGVISVILKETHYIPGDRIALYVNAYGDVVRDERLGSY